MSDRRPGRPLIRESRPGCRNAGHQCLSGVRRAPSLLFEHFPLCAAARAWPRSKTRADMEQFPSTGCFLQLCLPCQRLLRRSTFVGRVAIWAFLYDLADMAHAMYSGNIFEEAASSSKYGIRGLLRPCLQQPQAQRPDSRGHVLGRVPEALQSAFGLCVPRQALLQCIMRLFIIRSLKPQLCPPTGAMRRPATSSRLVVVAC